MMYAFFPCSILVRDASSSPDMHAAGDADADTAGDADADADDDILCYELQREHQ